MKLSLITVILSCCAFIVGVGTPNLNGRNPGHENTENRQQQHGSSNNGPKNAANNGGKNKKLIEIEVEAANGGKKEIRKWSSSANRIWNELGQDHFDVESGQQYAGSSKTTKFKHNGLSSKRRDAKSSFVELFEKEEKEIEEENEDDTKLTGQLITDTFAVLNKNKEKIVYHFFMVQGARHFAKFGFKDEIPEGYTQVPDFGISMPLGTQIHATTAYLAVFDYSAGIPCYIYERITASNYVGNGIEARRPHFYKEAIFPNSGSYYLSGYHQAHNSASANFRLRQELMRATFLYTNVVPMAPEFNTGLWLYGESGMRLLGLARPGLESVIIPMYNRNSKALDGKIVIPDAFAKLALYKRFDGRRSVTSFVMPHQAELRGRVTDYLVDWRKIQEMVGRPIFPELSQKELDEIVSNDKSDTFFLDCPMKLAIDIIRNGVFKITEITKERIQTYSFERIKYFYGKDFDILANEFKSNPIPSLDRYKELSKALNLDANGPIEVERWFILARNYPTPYMVVEFAKRGIEVKERFLPTLPKKYSTQANKEAITLLLEIESPGQATDQQLFTLMETLFPGEYINDRSLAVKAFHRWIGARRDEFRKNNKFGINIENALEELPKEYRQRLIDRLEITLPRTRSSENEAIKEAIMLVVKVKTPGKATDNELFDLMSKLYPSEKIKDRTVAIELLQSWIDNRRAEYKLKAEFSVAVERALDDLPEKWRDDLIETINNARQKAKNSDLETSKAFVMLVVKYGEVRNMNKDELFSATNLYAPNEKTQDKKRAEEIANSWISSRREEFKKNGQFNPNVEKALEELKVPDVYSKFKKNLKLFDDIMSVDQSKALVEFIAEFTSPSKSTVSERDKLADIVWPNYEWPNVLVAKRKEIADRVTRWKKDERSHFNNKLTKGTFSSNTEAALRLVEKKIQNAFFKNIGADSRIDK